MSRLPESGSGDADFSGLPAVRADFALATDRDTIAGLKAELVRFHTILAGGLPILHQQVLARNPLYAQGYELRMYDVDPDGVRGRDALRELTTGRVDSWGLSLQPTVTMRYDAATNEYIVRANHWGGKLRLSGQVLERLAIEVDEYGWDHLAVNGEKSPKIVSTLTDRQTVTGDVDTTQIVEGRAQFTGLSEAVKTVEVVLRDLTRTNSMHWRIVGNPGVPPTLILRDVFAQGEQEELPVYEQLLRTVAPASEVLMLGEMIGTQQALADATFAPNRALPVSTNAISLANELGAQMTQLVGLSLTNPPAVEYGRIVYVMSDGQVWSDTIQRGRFDPATGIGTVDITPEIQARDAQAVNKRDRQDRFFGSVMHSHQDLDLPASTIDIRPLLLGDENIDAMTAVMIGTYVGDDTDGQPRIMRTLIFRGEDTPQLTQEQARQFFTPEMAQEIQARMRESVARLVHPGMTKNEIDAVNALVQFEILRELAYQYDLRILVCPPGENVARQIAA